MDYEKVLVQYKVIVQEDVKSLLVPSSLVAWLAHFVCGLPLLLCLLMVVIMLVNGPFKR